MVTKKVVCNVCGRTYDDEGSIKLFEKRMGDGTPCPDMSCPGSLQLVLE